MSDSLRRAAWLRQRGRHLIILTLFVASLGGVAGAADAPGRIEESRFVTIGGLEQWITIRGASKGSPVVLFLHGGPGDTQSQFIKTYEPLERDFVIVHWDQRGAGKTRARANEQTRNASLDQLTSDGIELAQYLRNYLGTTNLVLVGHSWGSFLGVHVAKQRPELFRAFVGTGQVVSATDIVDDQYRYTLERARQTNNLAATAELEALGVPTFSDFDKYLKMRRWLNHFLAPSDLQWIAAQDSMLQQALSAEELKAYWEGFGTMTGLASTVSSMDLRPLGYRFGLPFFIIQGTDDHITPTVLAASYFQRIDAPTKQMITIDGAGHFAAMTHTHEFAAALQSILRRVSQ
jgi:pimeloyl-ACP methyl ester carboxylesterase